VEKPNVNKAKEGQTGGKQSQEHDHHFDIKGIVHKEFVPTGKTVNSGLYCKVLRRLREKVRRHRPQLWREQTWLLHHDKAPSHTAVLTHQFLAKNKIALIPHPPYSPDLGPCDFFLFPKMKLKLKGRRIDTRRSRPKSRKCLTLWQKRTSRKRSKNGGDGGTGVYTREGTISRVTTADSPYGKFYDFYSVSPENFGSTLV